ncbi:DUF6950 family protein [Paracoccus marcusii]|uniref:DUF6950 family protein n=1 Tax=Paracoccus marcusii TaxID=59779 RepID=UPI002493A267|nr:hypothetical protein [Paracoccus marcusii]
MAAGLNAFVAAGAALPWIWGGTDCTAWMSDWCRLHWGHDPIADLRGTYDTEAGADALIAGGLTELLRPRMAPLRITPAPVAGDVGVIRILGQETAAICTGKAWAFRTLRGLGEAPARPIIAWSK